MSIKISIMIPLYNEEKYLYNLYENIHSQTYCNFEAILIDDFSTDNTYKIIKEFQRKDERFKAVQVEKKGGNAVKVITQAMKYCTGDYFFYASKDDFFDKDIFEKCVEKYEETGAEIIIPNMTLYYGEKNKIKFGEYPLNNDYSQILSGKEAFLLSLDWKIHGNAFRKMDLFKIKPFKADYYNSDEFYFRQMLTFADKVAFCDSTFYYRQDNENAITKGKRYFHVDIIATDLLLLETMIDNDYPFKICFKRIIKLSRKWLGFVKGYGLEKYLPEQKQYVLKSLKNSGRLLAKLYIKMIMGK